MATPLTNDLRQEYLTLFTRCVIRPEHQAEAENTALDIVKNKARYQTVGSALNIPWCFIGVIHCMEGSLNFKTHLHNGDPLTARTVHVPQGRPPTGDPPFTWEASAIDALTLRKLNTVTDWTVPGMLYQVEGYNGFGYRGLTPPIRSPYLWSFSEYYTAGKFVGDHLFDPHSVSKQCGGAVILREMQNRAMVQLASDGTLR